jgi:hypothetical protein
MLAAFLLLLPVLFYESLAFSQKTRIRPVDLKNICISSRRYASNEDDLVKDGSVEYYKGLLTSNDEKDSLRDNITPNLKFAGALTLVIVALFAAFLYANKDIPPPTF